MVLPSLSVEQLRNSLRQVLRLTLVLLSGGFILGCHRRSHLQVVPVSFQQVADGREHRIASVDSDESSQVRLQGLPEGSFRIAKTGVQRADIYLRTPVRPGDLKITVRNANASRSFALHVVPDEITTADGTPDWMRLHAGEDRQAFRRWFTAIADRAPDTSPAELAPEITDCASFIRYVYREALRAHDDRWYAQFPANFVPSLASIQQWTYPNTPLGVNLYRNRSGPFHPSDLKDGTFAQFADAKTLHADNSYLLGRNLRLAKPGDLIFYRVLETNSQYHSMIITGEHGEWVVYNTGPDHGHHGEMRRVLLADLLRHPDPQWRPEPANPNWLGVYRWNILRED